MAGRRVLTAFGVSLVGAMLVGNLLAAQSPAAGRDAPAVIRGTSTRDGEFRAYATVFPNWGNRRPARFVRDAYTPVYPESLRASRYDCRCLLYVHVDSMGAVTSIMPQPRKPGAGIDSCGVFDSVSVNVARSWRFEPGPPTRYPLRLDFRYVVRPVAAEGEGSVLVFVLESVSKDSIESGSLGLSVPARVASVRSYGRKWTRLHDLPAGKSELRVDFADFLQERVPITVPANGEDTVSVLLTPRKVVPAGHTYWTHPAAALPIRAEDLDRYPLTGFSFVFETGRGERVDTASGLVTKDMFGQPDTTIQLTLTPDELDRVRRKMIEIRFFDLAENPPPIGNAGIEPNTFNRLEVTAGGQTSKLLWTSAPESLMYPSDNWKRLRDLLDLIREIVGDHPEYQALPITSGTYI